MWDWSAFVGGLTPSAVMEQINLVLAQPVVWSLMLLSIGVYYGARIVRLLQRLLKDTPNHADVGDWTEAEQLALMEEAAQRELNEDTAEFARASRADQAEWENYNDRMGGFTNFRTWRHQVNQASGAYNIHDSLRGLKETHRGEYAKAKRREKQNHQAGRTWGRAEARARRRANKAGRQFNKTAWENRRMQGEVPL